MLVALQYIPSRAEAARTCTTGLPQPFCRLPAVVAGPPSTEPSRPEEVAAARGPLAASPSVRGGVHSSLPDLRLRLREGCACRPRLRFLPPLVPLGAGEGGAAPKEAVGVGEGFTVDGVGNVGAAAEPGGSDERNTSRALGVPGFAGLVFSRAPPGVLPR